MSERTLEQAIGGEVKRRREAAGVRQEAVALAAQSLELLDWSQPTVSALEAGRRGISVGELALLPSILHRARISPRILRIVDMIPDSDEIVVVAGSRRETLRGTRTLVDRAPVAHVITPEGGTMTTLGTPASFALVTEADRKLARKLQTTPKKIAAAAEALWGRGVADERDHRIGAALTTLSPRSLQAVRGRVTRALEREITAWRKIRRTTR